jgi:hypothetical protein
MRAGRTVELPGIPLKGRDLLSVSIDLVPPEVQAKAFTDLCGVAREAGHHIQLSAQSSDIARTWERQKTSPQKKLLIVP